MSGDRAGHRTDRRHSSAAAFEIRHQLTSLDQREASPAPSVEAVAFSSENIGEFTQVITLDGRCEESTMAEAYRRICDALDAGRTQIVFDLRGLISVERSMLYMLSRGAIEAKARSGRLAIVRPNDHVWVLFEDAGLGRIFPTFATLRDAVATTSRW
jgi:anti-anti-sigma regulatory factor